MSRRTCEFSNLCDATEAVDEVIKGVGGQPQRRHRLLQVFYLVQDPGKGQRSPLSIPYKLDTFLLQIDGPGTAATYLEL
jgi:hypothetical protein